MINIVRVIRVAVFTEFINFVVSLFGILFVPRIIRVFAFDEFVHPNYRDNSLLHEYVICSVLYDRHYAEIDRNRRDEALQPKT